MLNLTDRRYYWACQLGGWLLYIFLNGFFLYVENQFSGQVAFRLALVFFEGVLLTEALRWLIIRLGWLKLPIQGWLPRVLFMNFVMGVVFILVQTLLRNDPVIEPVRLLVNSVPYTFLFFFWSVIYFLVHFIDNYKKAEIGNLRWQAAIHEAELNKLKSQLNPHFMFNAMNSIRALVGENPERAKEAVTQLSNLLRNILQMGRHKLIPFSQELSIVRDYLSIESVRLEERLRVEWHIDPRAEAVEVPPMMIQTLVENGIKHGIARLPGGGVLSLHAELRGGGLLFTIRNSGYYDPEQSPGGFGMRNTRERLALLYQGHASLEIENAGDKTVITKLFIPTNPVPAQTGAQQASL
jgi:two-component system, LytTR family, sensor kinase